MPQIACAQNGEACVHMSESSAGTDLFVEAEARTRSTSSGPIGLKGLFMKNIVLHFSSEESSGLDPPDSLELFELGTGEEINGLSLEKMSPNVWRCLTNVQLETKDIVLVVMEHSNTVQRARPAVLTKEYLGQCTAKPCDCEWMFSSTESCYLKITFSIGAGDATAEENVSMYASLPLLDAMTDDAYLSVLNALLDSPFLVQHLVDQLHRRAERTYISRNPPDAFRLKKPPIDLNRSILGYQILLEITSPDDGRYSTLMCGIGDAFLLRFEWRNEWVNEREKFRNSSDLDQASSYLESAVALISPEEELHLEALNSLAYSQWYRYEQSGDARDLVFLKATYIRIEELTTDGLPEFFSWLENRGDQWRRRFQKWNRYPDLLCTILCRQCLVDLAGGGDSNLSLLLIDLAECILQRYRHDGKVEDLHAAISAYRGSATHSLGRPPSRLEGARRWAELYLEIDDSRCIDGFQVAIQLLPLVADINYTIHERYIHLVEAARTSTMAASAALRFGHLETAVEWLEQGRCLIWNHLNELRTPVDELRVYDPSLADTFLRITQRLETSGSQQPQVNGPYSEETISKWYIQSNNHQIQRELSNDWKELLGKIRSIPHLTDFLRPIKALALLSEVPHGGTIVMLNMHSSRCDALALVAGTPVPIHIPLEEFSYQRAEDMRAKLTQELQHRGVRMRHVDEDRGVRRFVTSTQNSLPVLLRELWLMIVRPVLQALGLIQSSPPPAIDRKRIWWCPTGPLAFLPVHAAGIYGKNVAPGSCISDFVVSSYTTTVSMLLAKLRSTSAMADTRNSNELLLISQPATPGFPLIPSTTLETRELNILMTKNKIKSLLLDNENATVEHVRDEMITHRWVHFACHAQQNTKDGLKSAVNLYDGQLELLEITKVRLLKAEHVFLSACQTSAGDEKLSEEAVHLAAGMLAAGYRGAVATMWSIKDTYGPEIAQDFYANILERSSQAGGKGLEVSRSAYALDYATQKCRKRLDDSEEALLTWVPYVHFGV